MPGIELLDKNGKAKELSSTEKIGAIKIAIDYCDPKLVQLLLGARYCQLWQYWLVRAIFNYDMLSLSKMAKCELPLAIANEQLRYLADKEHIDVEELNSIQADKKIEYCRKIEEFYGNDRILEIKRSPEGVQLESATGGSLVESMAKQIAGGHLQGYQNNNEGCNVSDSIIAAVNANFSQECKSMIGGTIEECQQEVKDAKGVRCNRSEAKEGYLNIVRILAVNGAHSESLIHTFDTEELKKIAQQSIFTVAKKAYEVLFDFDKSDEAKLMSTIVGEDGKFADHVNQNVRILEYSDSPIVKTILDKLRKVEGELQENRKSGKANRETGLFNAIYYTVSDSIGKLFGKECEPQIKEEHAQVYKALYEALDISYLAMATGDDRVLIDYAEEIESRIKKESNKDIVKVYSVLYSLFKDYRITRRKEDTTSDTSRWQRLWYHFQDIFHTYHNDVREDRKNKFLRIAMYATEIISEEYEEYQRQRSPLNFAT
ncbi:uncharacterized protein TNCT_479121 [Trichonephila clavata]|uniref:Uncharacterized protein n=1 Tax=Trichonephila clavata TaxID=2740835 RepID=A0A8X6FAP9_TRICU|nr:uncharacterized protein TNCT_479121 [Trichonephila clavata]